MFLDKFTIKSYTNVYAWGDHSFHDDNNAIFHDHYGHDTLRSHCYGHGDDGDLTFPLHRHKNCLVHGHLEPCHDHNGHDAFCGHHHGHGDEGHATFLVHRHRNYMVHGP